MNHSRPLYFDHIVPVILGQDFSMKIAFLTSTGYPTRNFTGGVAIYTRNMAQALASLGHQVTVISKADKNETEYDGKVRVIWARLPNMHYYVSKVVPNSTDIPTVIRDDEWGLSIRKIVERIVANDGLDVIQYPEVWTEGLAHPYHFQELLCVMRLHTPMCM